MNFKTKLLFSFLLVLFITAFCVGNFANAATRTGTTTFELVEDKICSIDMNGFAKFEKKLTDFNKEQRSATLTLTLTNIKEIEQDEKDVEIFLVIDNSSSMTKNNVGNETREKVVLDSANVLVDKLFAKKPNVKIGVVSFSSLDSTKGETEGTINDAKLLLTLNNSKSDVKSAINSIPANNAGARTNIEAGVTLASQNYSQNDNTNRFIVLLTDGVPNNALDGTFGKYDDNVANRTKSKLQQIEQSGIDIIGAMIGLKGDVVEQQSKKTYKALAEAVFGSVEAPTISSYYYVTDNKSDIEATIVEKIYSDIFSQVNNTLEDITIKDYFPKEIVDNFNFAYVTSANIGDISTKIDLSDNSITWKIKLLEEGKVAKAVYKLTLKDDYNSNIIDKILPTNTKVDITGNNKGQVIEKTSTDSPTVRVRYKEPDKTVAPSKIPQAGDTSTFFIITISIILIITTISFFYFRKK